jgi:serine/threonine-protein kinase HipA
MSLPQAASLVMVMGGQRIGEVFQESNRLRLLYDSQWRLRLRATPVSLSMPLGLQEHGDEVVRPFLWGLLPDNQSVLERWGREYHISPRNPFALLQHVGEDCAGAVQFVLPQRFDPIARREGGVRWVSDAWVAEKIKLLRSDPSAWHLSRETGRFSLAGAQAKTAILYDPVNDAWGEPFGAVPTTHIIKPAISGLDDHDLNEHLCLTAARSAGITAANSAIHAFAGERVIVVERYDRTRRPEGTVERIHQEDFCQATGTDPTGKYQSEGGPSPERIVQVLRESVRPVLAADRDIASFVNALAFNWIAAGTDAHAKNYSLLLAGSQVRLAPLYDLASALPYEDMYAPKLKMAMKIGGEYRAAAVTGRHWRKFAEAAGLDPETVVAQVVRLAEQLPAAFAHAAEDPRVLELGSSLPERLSAKAKERAGHCLRQLVGK